MRRQEVKIILLISLLIATVLLAGCSQDATEAALTSTPQLGSGILTAVATPAATPETAEEPGLVTAPTPKPTLAPGPGEVLVEKVTEGMGIDKFSILGLTSGDWINLFISLLLIGLGYLVTTWLVNVALHWLVRRTPGNFDDRFLETIRTPVRWLVVIAIVWFATLRLDFLQLRAVQLFRGIYFSLALGIACFMVWRLLDYTIQWYQSQIELKHGDTKYESALPLLQKGGRFLLVTAVIIVWLEHFGVHVTGLVAALGIGGFALSLAAQDTLSDAISGLVILLDRPFRIGDRIEIQDLGTWGDVVEIGTRTTRILTTDNRMVVVPNSKIGKSQVVNYSFPDTHYRVELEIGLMYSTDIERARQAILEAARQVEGVLPDRPVEVLFIRMDDSALVFRVRWWVESYIDTYKMYDRMYSNLKKTLDKKGIGFPFPTQTTHLEISQTMAGRVAGVFRPNNDDTQLS